MPDGSWAAFPEKLREKAIAQGNITPDPEEGDPSASDLPDHGKKGKAELAQKSKEQEKAQKLTEAEQKRLDLLNKVARI